MNSELEQSKPDACPLYHRIPVADLPAHGRDVSIDATETERVAIAAICDLVSVSRLSAKFHVSKGTRPLLAVQGSLSADIVQSCGVTLEPVFAHVDAEIVQPFTLKSPSSNKAEIDVTVHDDDPPEPAIDGEIDFGALAFEHFVLNLDPYPRAPDAQFEPKLSGIEGEGGDSSQIGPFSALAKLKQEPGKT